MDKDHLTKQFACRLRDAMLSAGFNSQRSTAGVSIHKLAEITGYSVQICRKYLRGEAIPEPLKLVELAHKLNVSPGWLLFGDTHCDSSLSSNTIAINKKLLKYIFSKAGFLYSNEQTEKEAATFLIELIIDISQINTNEEQTKKIIDLAFSSIRHFR
jgi:transcriptional regulator with XRE-family HTH domain